jgi:hypothetical protein
MLDGDDAEKSGKWREWNMQVLVLGIHSEVVFDKVLSITKR